MGCGIQEQSTGYISGIMLSLHQTTEFVIKIKVKKLNFGAALLGGGICLLCPIPGSGVTTNSATATNCVSLYDLRGIH